MSEADEETGHLHDHAAEDDEALEGCGIAVPDEEVTPDEDLPAARGGVA
jgi:hypothetical protein